MTALASRGTAFRRPSGVRLACVLFALLSAGVFVSGPTRASSTSDRSDLGRAPATTTPALVGGTPRPAYEPTLDALSGSSFSIFQKRPLRIGVITLSETPQATKAIEITLEAIRSSFAPYPVFIDYRVPSEELEEGIRKGEVDVFVASSGFYYRLMREGARSLATLISDQQPDPNHGTATTLLVRAEDDRFQTLADLKGHRLSASYETAFMSFRIGMGEIAKRGFDPETFFSGISFLDETYHEAIVAKLHTGEAQAAMVRSCWLESQPPNVQKRYRVIDPKTNDPLRCLHTSATYPNLMVSVSRGSPPGAAQRIAQTLFNLKDLPTGHHWGIATDLRAIDDLYRTLKIEHYAYLREMSFADWWTRYKVYVYGVFAGIALLLVHVWRTEVLVRRRTKELREVMEEERRARSEVDRMRERMEGLQKMTVLGQLGNLIAHELAQPLAAVQYYAEGLRLLVERSVPQSDLLKTSVQGIEKGLQRTKAIVEKVRRYSKNETFRSDRIDLRKTIDVVLAALNADLRQAVHCRRPAAGETALVCGDTLELELLFSNLLKNAFEAAYSALSEKVRPAISGGTEEASDACVSIDLAVTDGAVTVTIENTGTVLSDDEIKRLTEPFFTSKSTGLGLGVPIAIGLAEASGGHIDFTRRESGGLRVCVTLPRAPKEDDGDEPKDETA